MIGKQPWRSVMADFRCGGNGVMEKGRAKWYPGREISDVDLSVFRLRIHILHWVLEDDGRLAPEKRNIFPGWYRRYRRVEEDVS